MAGSKNFVTPDKFTEVASALRAEIYTTLEREIALCADLELVNDKHSGGLWSSPSLPTVDSKTAHKISVSVIERVLGCAFQPSWIRRGGYETVAEATDHIMDRLKENCVKNNVAIVA